MKKRIWGLIIAGVCFTGSATAQTFAEWFQQGKTQKKYLLQQIAALQVYINYLEKGYAIVQTGLNTVHNIKNGEFNLHHAFFTSLKNVNPKVREYGRIADIAANQLYVLNCYQSVYKNAVRSGLFATTETDLFYTSFTHLLDDVSATLEQVLLVVTDGKLEMTDDERLKRIDGLFADSQQQKASFQNMQQQISFVGRQRVLELAEDSYLKNLYNLK